MICIPTWAAWALGVPAGACVLAVGAFLAALAWAFIFGFRTGD